ncbi:prolyl oligopeptidase family serine peptidase [Flavihumibacter sp. CACIAM 22H1]|uniref:S9 family peptidase n=1 Tax=Flavihumibacter sp. CACIAM 22H1 TaxID=1812911 RepID=UPI0007A83AB5|nr:prolyl oligopeptidase family serine peptidase [Flavihumibacter sp. CACIAM 22H1]KYP15745.1 MAG: peptidase S9 [Flavihumibacter sp. CACIAM 22H1]
MIRKGLAIVLYTVLSLAVKAQEYSLESVTSYPFPSELSAATIGSRIALALNEQGKRNIYVAEGPDFVLKKRTLFDRDEGLEISCIRLSSDGKWIAFVRGGDYGAFDETMARNPASSPVQQKVQVMSLSFEKGEPIVLDEGIDPIIDPSGTRVIYVKNGALWEAALDGSSRPQRKFHVRGTVSQYSYSPDGKQLVFVSNRRDHSFIGIYTDSTQPIRWIAPAIARDGSPRWSPDGKQLVFVRRNAAGGRPDSITVRRHQPWSILVADPITGTARKVWTAPTTLRGSFPGTQGGTNLHWAAGNRIVFVSYMDGWPHLYAVPAEGGNPLLLTKGDYMLEHIKLSPDRKWLIASANTGPDKDDFDRRHIVKVSVEQAAVEVLTPGKGIEALPVITGDQQHIAFISATSQQPGIAAVMPFEGGRPQLIGASFIPPDFPTAHMVSPRSVRFRASDGVLVHAQLFEPPTGGSAKKPAIVFIHGGPQRQMLLGWHYGDYYSNTYALNQYLASKGFVVLSVNYRLGIGYGYEFQYPKNWGSYGASEYLDVKAAGNWLAQQPFVDPTRIGTYGGSYGGYLVALALGKDSRLFKAGVDIHGVHTNKEDYPSYDGEQAPDAEYTRKLIWTSSPVAWVKTWTSPVLFIHGDDDGNVPFSETVDLVKRFEQMGKPYESLVIPDETHHWMRYHNQVLVDKAVAEFLQRKLIK